MTWQIDRILRAGPLCAVATLLLPACMALLVNSQRGTDDVLGIMLVASGIIFIGSIAGSIVTSGLGAVLFGLGTVMADVPIATMVLVGSALYISLVLHDLAGAFHRGPRISGAVWRDTALTTLALVGLSAVIFAVTHVVGGLATWQSIVVPFAIAAIGFAAKLAADAHRASARQLTARRLSETDSSSNQNSAAT